MIEKFSKEGSSHGDAFTHKFNEGNLIFWVQFGGGGHEGEYTVNIEGFDQMDFVPCGMVAFTLQEKLGNDWIVSSRGSRIEIAKRGDKYGERNDKEVEEAIKNAVKQNINKLNERKKS